MAQAVQLNPPGPLRVEHDHLIEVLKLRSSGLSRLADAFRQTATATARNSTVSGRLIADQARLLVASDVNWDFYFKEPTQLELQNQGITDIGAVPDSNIVPNPELASTQAMTQVWLRVHGAATGGGTTTGNHGSALVSVTALPDGKRLDPNGAASDNAITASTDLAFRVAVTDSGDFQEFNVGVTLTIQKSPKSIVKRLKIDRDQRRRDEDDHVHEHRHQRPVRTADDGQGRRRARAGREDHDEQLLRVQSHLLPRRLACALSTAEWIAIGPAPLQRSRCSWPGSRGGSCARCVCPSSSCSAAGSRISSTSPSRSRDGSTICTGRWTRSRPGSRGSIGGSTPPSRKTSLVRYDAYEGAGGHQSASIALLDAGRSGVVLTAIQGRDYARIYVKELDHGRPSVALSPEEEEAVERAMAG